MKTMLLAAAAVGLLAPLSTVASPASGEAIANLVCKSRSWNLIETYTVAGRKVDLWKCKGQPYYHAGLARGAQGDLVRVFKRTSSGTVWRAGAWIAAGNSGVATAALELEPGERVWACAYPAGYKSRCSKVYLYKVSCPPRGTTPPTTIPAGCRN